MVAVGYSSSDDAADALVSEIADAGGTARAFQADMEDPAAPAKLVKEVSEALGPVDLLVANHGVAHHRSWETLDAASFDRTFAINTRASFLLAQAALPEMRARGYGRILFVSSAAAFTGGVIGPDYTASKAALHGLVYFLARQVSAEGVTVNALAPGFVETAMLPVEPAELARSVPVGRVGQPEEVAEMAAAILGNGYMNNKVIGLDGGTYPR